MSSSAYNTEWKTLTHAVQQIVPDPMYFQQRLGGKPAITSPTTTSEFDVVRGRRDLAPMGFPGDPATRVDYSESFETFSVTPPQIFLEDPVKANVLAAMRMPGQSPYLTGSGPQGDLSPAFMRHVAIKQRNMVNAIARRKEWMWAMVATTGKIDYTDANGRRFKIDFGVHIGVEQFNQNLVACFYLILLTTGLNDCIHDNCTSSYQTRPIAVARIKPRTYTAPERLTERS